MLGASASLLLNTEAIDGTADSEFWTSRAGVTTLLVDGFDGRRNASVDLSTCRPMNGVE